MSVEGASRTPQRASGASEEKIDHAHGRYRGAAVASGGVRDAPGRWSPSRSPRTRCTRSAAPRRRQKVWHILRSEAPDARSGVRGDLTLAHRCVACPAGILALKIPAEYASGSADHRGGVPDAAASLRRLRGEDRPCARALPRSRRSERRCSGRPRSQHLRPVRNPSATRRLWRALLPIPRHGRIGADFTF